MKNFCTTESCPSTGDPLTEEWVLTDVADSTQLGTRERVRANVAKILASRTVTAPGPLDGGREQSDRRVQEAERRAMEAEARAREAERRAKALESRAETRVRETERKARKSVMEAERRSKESIMEAERRASQSEERVRESDRRARESESRAMEAEGRARELEAQWVVERREIQLTDQELGRGAWATVSVATFRGACVAAKCVHNQIISDYNIQLFKREMDMAARIRHPNLLLFIGATLEGQMVILTELMPTSLRRELESDGYLPRKSAISIGLDVARALNYLHQMRPHPLIHRDISSANVLLELLFNGHWRAKVSDYGTVNLQENLTTKCPGNPCYAAPEAETPSQQSPKMDIFSFGVLLMEMLTGEFPAREHRGRLLGRIHHQPLLALIQRCLEVRPGDRPDASDIITNLGPQP